MKTMKDKKNLAVFQLNLKIVIVKNLDMAMVKKIENIGELK